MTSPRYEMKIQCSQSMLPTARSWARLNSAGFSETYPPRQVNNIYFDTFGLDTFNDHIEGVPERRKLRFRWYGQNLEEARGQLEMKEKHERVGWKRIYPVGSTLDMLRCDWSDLQQAIIKDLQGEDGAIFREMLLTARPLVINSYQREYFASADGRVRLTLDYNQCVYDQWLTPRPNLVFRAPLLDELVIEFKCEREHSRYLADVLAEFPLRTNRHSKFVSALGSLLER